jgi:hypothetical protein
MRLGAILLLAGCGSKIPNTGGFRETIIDKSVRHGQQIDIADVDGDGTPDVVAALSITDAVHVYLNSDSQSFDAVSVSGPGTIVAVDSTTFDVDGDFDLDVVAIGLSQRIRFNQSAGELAWYENPGADAREAWESHEITKPNLADTSSKSDQLPWGGQSIDNADFDGDGIIDVVIGLRNAQDERGTFFGNRVDWYKNMGNQTFTGPMTVGSLMDVAVVLTVDVDGDGMPDVVAGSDDGEVAWFKNEGMAQDGLQFTKYTISSTEAVHGLAFGNLDDDADRELVTAGYTGTSSVVIAYFDRPANMNDPWIRHDVDSGFGGNRDERPKVAIADFDGDGTDEVAASSLSRGDLRVYRRSTEGFDRTDVRGGYGGLSGLITADIDGDGRIDIVTSTFEFGSRDRIAWWKNETFPAR